MLQPDPVLYRAEVVSDVQFARGLDARKDARHGLTTYASGGERRKVRELKDLVDVARRAAGRAAGLLRQAAPPSTREWGGNGPPDFVTEGDRRAEEPGTEVRTREGPGTAVAG